MSNSCLIITVTDGVLRRSNARNTNTFIPESEFKCFTCCKSLDFLILIIITINSQINRELSWLDITCTNSFSCKYTYIVFSDKCISINCCRFNSSNKVVIRFNKCPIKFIRKFSFNPEHLVRCKEVLNVERDITIIVNIEFLHFLHLLDDIIKCN